MLRWAPYPFVRVALSFAAGILLYIITGREFRFSLELLAFFFAAFVVAVLLTRRVKSAFATNIAGILALLTFFSAGLFTTHYRTAYHQQDHLLHLQEQPAHYTGVVTDYVVQKAGYQSTVVEVQQVLVNGSWQRATGRVQLSVPHDSDKTYELAYGDVLLVKGSPEPVAPPANPGQFDYRQYLANKNIYHRHYLQAYQYGKVSNDPPLGILSYSIQLRGKLDALLQEKLDEKREYGIASALLLGVKDELDNNIRKTYANTGTMHVLAVSGLHVGLIFTVLMLLLTQFNRTGRQRLVGAVVILLVLWLYAFITGLSPSVLRAVLMFSLVTVGLAIKRRTNIYNTVAVAALVLLFINPYNLLEVGFQLSFLAVLGIVYLQPRLYTLVQVDNWLLDKVWALFTVAIAAQLATFPLGLFYFHQFPVYFWLANIVVVPMATVVLYSGMVALAFSWVPGLSWLLFKLHFGFIWLMNEFNVWVQQLPGALINGIDISLLQAVLLYMLMFTFILFLFNKRLRYVWFATGIVAVFSVQEILEVVEQKNQKLLTVYSLRGSTGVSLLQGQQAVVIADSALLQDENNYTFNVQPQLWARGVQQPEFVTLGQDKLPFASSVRLADENQLLVWQGQSWLILSSPPVLQPKEQLQTDYILLRNNVRLEPGMLPKYTFKQIIIDASNSIWYRKKLKEQLDAQSIAYHDIAEDGAFIVEVE
ncbi:ComEC/Rec2 family competence protein [Pontibacter locisalis]|uniref:ComEC/Rec2 family competence protein n=1 Tax=Pontibacter locisalis TaxID=1719035 RepID=A0ABW5IPF3_9BACT